jgi:hypothetical protein
MIEIVDDVICVSNWEKYQNVEGMEKIKEQTRLRVAKHRERKKLEGNVTCNVTVTQSNATDIDIDKEKNKNNNIPPTPIGGEVRKKPEKKSNVRMFNSFINANQNNGLSDDVKNALLDWMEYKDQRKDYYADKGMQSLLNKALKKEKEFGSEAVVEVIGDSMASNYQGITWDILEKRKPKKQTASTQDDWDEWIARKERERNERK